MSTRSFPIFLITATFLLSSWGNVIAAAYCPRYLARDASVNQTVKQAVQAESGSCHHDMAQMDMDTDEGSMTMEGESTSETELVPFRDDALTQVAFELPNEPCGHCWMHSQPSSGTATVAVLSPSRQSVEASAPPADLTPATPVAFTTSIIPFEHGPPGNSLPRHVLINVFRI